MLEIRSMICNVITDKDEWVSRTINRRRIMVFSRMRISMTAVLTQLSVSDLLSAELCHSRRSSRPTMWAKRRDPLRWEEHHIFIIPHPVKTSASVYAELCLSPLSVWAVKDGKVPDVVSRQPPWRLWWCSNWISTCYISHRLALNIFSCHGDDLSDFSGHVFFSFSCDSAVGPGAGAGVRLSRHWLPQ